MGGNPQFRIPIADHVSNQPLGLDQAVASRFHPNDHVSRYSRPKERKLAANDRTVGRKSKAYQGPTGCIRSSSEMPSKILFSSFHVLHLLRKILRMFRERGALEVDRTCAVTTSMLGGVIYTQSNKIKKRKLGLVHRMTSSTEALSPMHRVLSRRGRVRMDSQNDHPFT